MPRTQSKVHRPKVTRHQTKPRREIYSNTLLPPLIIFTRDPAIPNEQSLSLIKNPLGSGSCRLPRGIASAVVLTAQMGGSCCARVYPNDHCTSITSVVVSVLISLHKIKNSFFTSRARDQERNTRIHRMHVHGTRPCQKEVEAVAHGIHGMRCVERASFRSSRMLSFLSGCQILQYFLGGTRWAMAILPLFCRVMLLQCFPWSSTVPLRRCQRSQGVALSLMPHGRVLYLTFRSAL